MRVRSGHNNIIINLEQLLEEEKRKAQSMAELMKNPSKVILLQVRLICTYMYTCIESV